MELCEYAYKCEEVNCCYPTSKEEECGGTCLPSTARVSLENGKSVAMSELRVGDRVQTGEKKFIVSNMAVSIKSKSLS